ncbi:isoprenyl transferase [Deltaproteobacteria bacterium]|nr:isoprenyl transferase [Deltaproteobacteria bacterium]
MADTTSSIPLQHLAVIMDGNGRWAKSRGLSRSEGHSAGSEAVRAVVRECRSVGIPYLTLYTFSRENWGRPKEEVRFLFDLLVSFLRKELPELLEQRIRLCIAGETDTLPTPVRKAINHAVSKTASCDAMTLTLALNYSGREEIAHACAKLMETGCEPNEVTPERIAACLYTAGQPDPDLVIRTSGEYRLSNFLLFQAAYSELYFTPTLWPDFTPEELRGILADFAQRERRFGKSEGADL